MKKGINKIFNKIRSKLFFYGSASFLALIFLTVFAILPHATNWACHRFVNRVASLAFFKPNFSILPFSKDVWLKKFRFGLYLIFGLFLAFFRKNTENRNQLMQCLLISKLYIYMWLYRWLCRAKRSKSLNPRHFTSCFGDNTVPLWSD